MIVSHEQKMAGTSVGIALSRYPGMRDIISPVVDHFLRHEHFRADILPLEKTRPALAGLADTLAGIKAKGASRKPGGRNLPAIHAAHPEVNALSEVSFDHEIPRFGCTLDQGRA